MKLWLYKFVRMKMCILDVGRVAQLAKRPPRTRKVMRSNRTSLQCGFCLLLKF